MTYFYDKNTTLPGIVRLERAPFGSEQTSTLAGLSSGTGSGYGWVNTQAISGGPADNSKYAYWVTWILPAWGSGDFVQAEGLTMLYEFRVFLPLVTK